MQCGSVSRFRDGAGGRASARVCRRWVKAKIKPHGGCGRMLEWWAPGKKLNQMPLQGLPR
jgi:hypothetical protein